MSKSRRPWMTQVAQLLGLIEDELTVKTAKEAGAMGRQGRRAFCVPYKQFSLTHQPDVFFQLPGLRLKQQSTMWLPTFCTQFMGWPRNTSCSSYFLFFPSTLPEGLCPARERGKKKMPLSSEVVRGLGFGACVYK